MSDGTIGTPVSVLVSRHIIRGLGKKISGRIKLSPAATESTHDLDFVLWCLEPAKPVRVYSQVDYGAMRLSTGRDVPDLQWAMVTMDSGLFVVGGGWSLPPGYPNFSSTWIEVVGTEGAIMVDDTHRDVVLNTVRDRLPDVYHARGVRRPRVCGTDGHGNRPFHPSRGARPPGSRRTGAGASSDGSLYGRRSLS